MEERGIGRPSTYASTIGTIQDRGYVSNRGSALIPSWLAFAVTRLMEEHFPRLVDYGFTASMEEDLDAIARGDARRAEWLRRFYFGDEAKSSQGLRDLVEDLGDIDARAISTIDIGDGIVVRVGRYGPYIEEVVPAGIDPKTGEVTDAAALGEDGAPAAPRRATINDDVAPDELTPAMARELLATAADDGRVLGQTRTPGATSSPRQGATAPTSPRCCPTRLRPRGRPRREARPSRRSRARHPCSRTWTSRPSTSTPP
jgi:DNA topoisomerase-1